VIQFERTRAQIPGLGDVSGLKTSVFLEIARDLRA
jgi:acetaldehyde dehydrogenase (acetylating)